MHLLYPSAPDRSNAVDELFAEEYDAARSAGLACSLFCDEELESGRFRARPEFPATPRCCIAAGCSHRKTTLACTARSSSLADGP